MADIVTLTDVRAHLRYPAGQTEDDFALQGFVYAVDDVIRHECGDVLDTSYDERHDGGNKTIFLRHTPVLSVENVEEGWGWWNYELDFQEVNTVPAGNMFAYSLDNRRTGEVTRRSAGNVNIPFIRGNGNIRVQYTAGRDRVPGAIRLAALELIAHWWQNSQLRSSAVSMASGASFDATSDDFSRTQSGYGLFVGVPKRVIELLAPYRHAPYFA